MLTRAQVARRLGKSIATVRRLEGTLLHPRLDYRGVNRFDPVDVEELRLRVRDGLRLPNGLKEKKPAETQSDDLVGHVRALRARLDDVEAVLAAIVEGLA